MLGNGGSSSSKTTFQKILASIGLTTDPMAGSDTGANSLIAFVKRTNDYLNQLITNFTNYTSTGVLTNINEAVGVAIGNRGAVGIQVSGTNAGGVVTFYASMDNGGSYFPVNVTPFSNGGDNNPVGTASAAGKFVFIGGGFTHFRAQLTTPGSGTFNVSLVATPSLRNVGVPSIGSALDTAASSDTGSATLIQLIKRLLLKTPAVASNTFTLNAAGQDCQVAVSEGHQTVSVSIAAGSINGTLNLQYSNDSGASWFNLSSQLLNTSATPTPSITATGLSWDAPIPADATHVRLYANSIVSGGATGKIIVSFRPFPAPQSVWAGLTAGSSRVGSVYAAEIHYQDTTTALTTGAPTFSATIRDCKNAGSGAVAGAASYAKTYSVIAAGDKTFDLFVYISENGSTLYKTYKVSATQVDSGLYVAEITITPKMRWAQAQATLTGGVSMTQFTMATSMFAN